MGFVRRRARRRTALVVGGAAYARGRRAGADQGDGGYDQTAEMAPEQQVPPAPPVPAPTEESTVDQLKELGELHANGTLTDEEFAAEKAKVLGS